MTLNFNHEAHKIDNSTRCTFVQVYKDTTASAVYSNYFCGTPNAINLTSLTQGYYYLRIFTYYSSEFTAYSLSPVFTQSTKAKITLVATDTSAVCDSTNSLTLKCTKSSAPYTVQLYRYNLPYGSPRVVNNTKNFVYSNLPKGNYYARAYGDGATGNTFGRFANTELMPEPVNPRTTAIQSAQARLNWNALSCANYFSVQYRKTSDTGWTTINTNGNTTFRVINGLTASTAYYWRVAAADSANGVTGLSAYTDSISFTTASAFAASINAGDANDIKASGTGQLITYPNPAKTQFTIQYNPAKTTGTISLLLKNMNGAIVWNRNNIAATAAKGTVADVSKLPPGVYMLQIIDQSNNTVAVKKVVVSR
jgi:Secretion system C-terminal sorting domain/Fibronectin type III domain